jgi:hypothetical protein
LDFLSVIDLGLDVNWSRLLEDHGEDHCLDGELGSVSVLCFPKK